MVDVKVVPDLLQVIALRARLEDLDGIPVININDVPLQGFNTHRQAGHRHRHLRRGAARCWRSRSGIIAPARAAHVARPGVLPAGAHGPRRQVVHHRQVPLDVRRCRAGDRAGVGEAERPARHAVRAVPAPIEPRRAAAALERAPRRHVDRRPAAGAAALRRAVQAQDSAVHAAPQGEGRTHRLGAGERLARQHAAREADRVRPLLHRELVGPPRSEDHVADAVRGFFHKHAY